LLSVTVLCLIFSRKEKIIFTLDILYNLIIHLVFSVNP
jgi:hypothetical protein